jgi:hypothetical protein
MPELIAVVQPPLGAIPSGNGAGTSGSGSAARQIVIGVESFRRGVHLTGDRRSDVGCRSLSPSDGAGDILPRGLAISINHTGARRRDDGQSHLVAAGPRRERLDGSSSSHGALCGKPEDQIILRLAGQGLFPLSPIGHGSAESFPEGRPVMAFAQVYQFMSDHVVDKPDRKLQSLPIEIDDPALSA